MLIDGAGDVTPFRPPSVHELTGEERRDLRAKLAGVVESWRGGIETGLRVVDIRQVEHSAPVDADADRVWFRAGAADVALGLTPEAAASVLCVNLGAAMPEDPATQFSEIDVALLQTWAGRALSELVGALGAGPAGEILRKPGPPEDLSAGQEWLVVAELTFAGDRPAGLVLIEDELARTRRTGPLETFADHPDLLVHARLPLEARIVAEPVPLQDLLSLESGDVLLLGSKANVEAKLMARDTAVAGGRPGARGEMRALRVMGDVLTKRDLRLGESTDGF